MSAAAAPEGATDVRLHAEQVEGPELHARPSDAGPRDLVLEAAVAPAVEGSDGPTS